MADLIFLRDLKIYTQIGDYEWEKKIKQPLIFDIELSVDIRAAATSGNLSETVDYAKLAQRIIEFVSGKAFILLETLAEEVSDLIFKEFNVKKLKLTVIKPAIMSNIKEAGIMIERP